MVVVNLYPFRETIAKEGVTEEDAVENIDIGGPAMIRAAAKNFKDVAVLVNPSSYDKVMAALDKFSLGAKQFDDITMLVVKRDPPGNPQ